MVKRSVLYACMALAATAALVPTAPAPAATAAAKATKNSCADKPSKWQRYQCENYTESAPGDQYFGRMKLSYLGINNTFHDEAISAGAYTTDSGIINKVGFADEALEQWAHLYPHDPQLARTYFLAIQIYKKIYTKQAQQKAWSYMHVLTTRFGNTYFGKIEKADLARGFTEHYFALPRTCPTPLPSGAVVPAVTPGGVSTPMPRPGQPAVKILQLPCVAPEPTASP